MTQPINYARMAACAKRELRHRKRVYWHLVGEQRMTADQADEEIAVMEAIYKHFDELANPKLL